MNNGWRYALHILLFGVAGPLLTALIAVLLSIGGSGDFSYFGGIGTYAMAVVMYAYGYCGIPALITGGVTAFSARKRAGWRLYGAAALAGCVAFPAWTACAIIPGSMKSVDSMAVFLKEFEGILLFLSLCGALSAPVCAWLARRLRPLPRVEAQVAL